MMTAVAKFDSKTKMTKISGTKNKHSFQSRFINGAYTDATESIEKNWSKVSMVFGKPSKCSSAIALNTGSLLASLWLRTSSRPKQANMYKMTVISVSVDAIVPAEAARPCSNINSWRNLNSSRTARASRNKRSIRRTAVRWISVSDGAMIGRKTQTSTVPTRANPMSTFTHGVAKATRPWPRRRRASSKRYKAKNTCSSVRHTTGSRPCNS
mmetsp:Transcript_18579/g.53217  ORF Transcript_18579/g.53217 Transcript_18579/m.53217 type:complete len:211 (+) Transcript_18579:213-845(+)